MGARSLISLRRAEGKVTISGVKLNAPDGKGREGTGAVWPILPAVEERSIPTAILLAEAHPALLEADVLTLEFPATAGFLRTQAEDPKNTTFLQEALYAVTGRRLTLAFAVGPDRGPTVHEHEHPATEEEIVELMKSTFDAREVDA